jgi:transcriptional regulator with XRE-family HTH domain
MPAPLNPDVIAQIKAILKSRGIKTKPTYQEIADANHVSLRTVKSLATGKHEAEKKEKREKLSQIRVEDQGYGRDVVIEVCGDEETLITPDYAKRKEFETPPVRPSDAEYLITRFTRFPHLLEGVETRLELEAKIKKQFMVSYSLEEGTILSVQRWMEGR